MSRAWKPVQDLEKRLHEMSLEELKVAEQRFTLHASLLAPKVQKQAMKRVHQIQREIEKRQQQVRQD